MLYKYSKCNVMIEKPSFCINLYTEGISYTGIVLPLYGTPRVVDISSLLSLSLL